MPSFTKRDTFILPLLICLILPIAICPQDTRSVALLDLEGRGVSQVEAASLTDRLRTALVRTGGVTVVERGQMEQVLSEQDFQLTGCTSDECAVEVGQLLGVTTMVAGSIGKVGATFSIDIRTIEVRSGQITHSLWRDYRGEIDGLLGIMPDIARELVAPMVVTTAPPEAPSPASITIATQPPGARVVLDGQDAGTTPVLGAEIEPNQSHTVSISLDGYQTVDTTLFAEAGQSYELDISLERLASLLTVLSNPPGAMLVIDGRILTSTPLISSEVAPGTEHDISLTLSGYQPVDTTLFTEAGQSYELDISLERLTSQLTILSNPSNAAVFLDNRRFGVTPLTLPEVTPNMQHNISLTLAGYQRVDTTYIARAGEHHRMNIALQPPSVAATTARPPAAPPPERRQPQPAVKPAQAGGGGMLVVLALLAATGYYGYTQGWFDGKEPPLKVGNPPSLPSP